MDSDGSHQNAAGGRSGVAQEGDRVVCVIEAATVTQLQTAARLDLGDLTVTGEGQLHLGAGQGAGCVHVDLVGDIRAVFNGFNGFGSHHGYNDLPT